MANKNLPFVYFDTSAYLTVLLDEPKAKAVQAIFKKSTPCSSVLLAVESERNLVRLAREGHLASKDFDLARDRLKADLEYFVLKELTLEIALSGEFPALRTPRSLDLVHIRTALWFKATRNADLSFCTLDLEQRAAATELGLKCFRL